MSTCPYISLLENPLMPWNCNELDDNGSYSTKCRGFLVSQWAMHNTTNYAFFLFLRASKCNSKANEKHLMNIRCSIFKLNEKKLNLVC